jgi:hypothetical protein
MNKERDNSKPEVPPMEEPIESPMDDPPLPDSYEPSPGEVPELQEHLSGNK